jgi:hypothetical protein
MSLHESTGVSGVLRLDAGPVLDVDAVSLERVRAALAGRGDALPRAHAIALLVASDFPNAHRDLAAVLEDEAAPSELRALAALALARTRSPAAPEILLRSAGVRDPRVLAAVLRALGTAGGEAALPAVLEAGKRATGAAAEEARFAASLISYRLGLAGNELPLPGERDRVEVPPDAARPIDVARAGPREAELVLRTLGPEPAGVELAEAPMWRLRCGRTAWMLALNRECAGADLAERAARRKLLAGVVAWRSPETGRWSVGLLVLTSPSAEVPGRVDVLACRPSGAVVLAGSARVDGASAEVSLGAVTRPGALGVRIVAVVERGAVRIREAVATPFARVAKRSAQAE